MILSALKPHSSWFCAYWSRLYSKQNFTPVPTLVKSIWSSIEKKAVETCIVLASKQYTYSELRFLIVQSTVFVRRNNIGTPFKINYILHFLLKLLLLQKFMKTSILKQNLSLVIISLNLKHCLTSSNKLTKQVNLTEILIQSLWFQNLRKVHGYQDAFFSCANLQNCSSLSKQSKTLQMNCNLLSQ